jgi:hypothetical protein
MTCRRMPSRCPMKAKSACTAMRKCPADAPWQTCFRRRDQVGSPGPEPYVRAPSAMRRVRRDRLLHGLGHVHRALLPLHDLRLLGEPQHPGLFRRKRLGCAAAHDPRRHARPKRGHLRTRTSAMSAGVKIGHSAPRERGAAAA